MKEQEKFIQRDFNQQERIKTWLKNIEDFKGNLGKIEYAAKSDPLAAISLLGQMEGFLLDSKEKLPVEEFDQYLAALALTAKEISEFEKAENLVMNIEKDIFIKIYYLLGLVDHYIVAGNKEKAREIITKTESIVPDEFCYESVEQGFMGPEDVARSKYEIKKRKSEIEKI